MRPFPFQGIGCSAEQNPPMEQACAQKEGGGQKTFKNSLGYTDVNDVIFVGQKCFQNMKIDDVIPK